MMQSVDKERTHIHFYMICVLFLSLGFLLRLVELGKPSLWIDEAFAAWFIDRTWGDLIYTLHLDGGNLPVHFLAVKLITSLTGINEFNLRLFSALSGTLAVLLAMILGWLVGKKPGSLAAGIFWALNPMTLWYSRDAKPYALSATMALALLIAYLMYLKNQRRSWALLALGIMVIGSFTHYYYFLVMMALVLFSITEIFRQPLFFRRWFLSSLLALIPLAGWLAWFFSQPHPSIGIGWIERPDILDIPQTFWNMLSGYGGVYSSQTTLFGVTALSLATAGIASGKGYTLSRLSLTLGLLVPIAAVWGISQKRPIYMDRYFIVLLPFVTVLLGEGAQMTWSFLTKSVSASSQRVFAVLALLSLTCIGLLAAWKVYDAEQYSREDWRGLSQELKERREGIPRLWMLDPESLIPFRFYYSGEAYFINSSQPPICKQPCWYVMRQPYTSTHAFAQGVASTTRPWKPALPNGCLMQDVWDSSTGLALWKVVCTDN